MSSKLVRELISGPEGFGIELFGLRIYRSDKDMYVVENEEPEFYKEFDDIDNALRCFYTFRRDCEIGFDFQKQSYNTKYYY